MGAVTESVDVAVPVTTAYNQWTQFEEFPHFMEGVTTVRQISDTLIHWETDIGGVKRQFDAQITEQLPDERVAWKSTEGVRQAGVVTFHRLDETHSRVTAQMEFEPEGVAEQTADKLGVLSRRIKGDLKRFKKFIEDRRSETGAWRGEVKRPQP
jgi:uncharacterized membrane protein